MPDLRNLLDIKAVLRNPIPKKINQNPENDNSTKNSNLHNIETKINQNDK